MTTKIRIFVRVAKRRIAAGENIEEVLASWPALSDAERAEIKTAVV